MLQYLVRRILSVFPVMALVAILVFSLLYLAPGDPAALIAGEMASADQIEAIRIEMGLDQPYLLRFVEWMLRILQGDFGVSIFSNKPVIDMILQRLEPTFSLMATTLVFAALLGIPLGTYAAWRAGSWVDRMVMAAAVIGFSIPSFVLGYGLAYIFAVKLHWLPVQGYSPLARGFGPWLSNLVLPSIALSGAYVALIARITRATVIEILRQDYIRTAKAKGVGDLSLIFIHALKNAAVPIVTVVGIGIAVLISGTVIIESVFSIPGLGLLTVDSILRRDYPVIQAVILLFSFAYVLVNLLIDLSYTLLDPRIRY